MMKRGLTLTILLVASVGAFAQAPVGVSPTSATPPIISPSIPIAIKSLQQRSQEIQKAIQELQADFNALDGEIKKEAPGFHLSPTTLAIEKETVTTTPPAPTKHPPLPDVNPKK